MSTVRLHLLYVSFYVSATSTNLRDQWTFPWPESSSTSTPSTPTYKTSRSYKVPLDFIFVPFPNSPCTDCFTKHKIDRVIPVESLVKCKMQDNLEFLQYSKRFWDQYFPGHEYDAVARRKGAGAAAPTTVATSAPRASMGSSTTRKTGATPVSRGVAGPRVGSAASGGASSALKAENEQLKEAIGGLEKERDFYFSKLRDIELLLQNAIEENPALETDDNGLVKNIQAILYSTEEGFEIPDLDEQNGEAEPETF
jgi:microtubule-associated protein, RP/EB family